MDKQQLKNEIYGCNKMFYNFYGILGLECYIIIYLSFQKPNFIGYSLPNLVNERFNSYWNRASWLANIITALAALCIIALFKS